MIRQVLAIILAGLIGHSLLLGAVLGASLGGAYAAFAAAAIQFSLLTAVLLRVTPDGLAQALYLTFGPFFAPVLAATGIVALFAILARRRSLIFQVFGAALLSVLPIAVRFGEVSPGGPAVGLDDILLVISTGALAGGLYWLIAGRRIGRQAAIKG